MNPQETDRAEPSLSRRSAKMFPHHGTSDRAPHGTSSWRFPNQSTFSTSAADRAGRSCLRFRPTTASSTHIWGWQTMLNVERPYMCPTATSAAPARSVEEAPDHRHPDRRERRGQVHGRCAPSPASFTANSRLDSVLTITELVRPCPSHKGPRAGRRARSGGPPRLRRPRRAGKPEDRRVSAAGLRRNRAGHVDYVYSLFPRLEARHSAVRRDRLLSGGEQQMLAVGRAHDGPPRSF